MTLRRQVVEAMAQSDMIAEYGVVTLDDDPEWYADAVSPGGFAYVRAEAALDAALDVLDTYAEDGHWLASIGDVIAALRDSGKP